MRQLKPILITAAVVLVLTGAALLVSHFWKAPSTPLDPSGGIDTGDTIYIIRKSAGAVRRVEIKTDNEGEFRIDYEPRPDGSTGVTVHKAEERFRYNTDEMETLTGYVGILAAVEEIPAEQGDDKLFGFDNPRRDIRVTYSDDEKIRLLIGGDSPIGSGVYLKRVDTGRVYLIGGSTTDVLMKTLRGYRDITLFDPIETIDSLRSVTLTRPGEDPIRIERKDGEPDPENPVAAIFQITSPVERDASNDTLDAMLLNPLIAVKSAALIEDYPKDLAKYGLDNPVKVEFTDVSDNRVAFSVGARADEGGHYLMMEDVPSVYTTEEDVTFLNMRYTDVVMQLIWLHNTEDVSRIEYTLPGGERHTLTLDVAGDNVSASFDGGEITRDNAVTLFLRTVRFTLQGEVSGGASYGAPEYFMSMTRKDGATTTLRLSKMNDRQYAASIDGAAPRYYVGVAEVEELAEAFSILAQGGTIPAMF